MQKLLNFLLIVLIFTVLQVTNVGAQDTLAPGSVATGQMDQDCASISEPAMRRECEEKEKSHHSGSQSVNGGDPYAKQCKEWKKKGSPAWDKHSGEHCSNK